MTHTTYSIEMFEFYKPALPAIWLQSVMDVKLQRRAAAHHLSDDFTSSERRCSQRICSRGKQLKTWKISPTVLTQLSKILEYIDSLMNPYSVGYILPAAAFFFFSFFLPWSKVKQNSHTHTRCSPSNQTRCEHTYHACFRNPPCMLSGLLVCPNLRGSTDLAGNSRTTETEELSKASWK